jgi:glycosyltransferase involved in cell wall biosynthesis
MSLPSHLVVIHSHWRPGGVRRVIEMALPAIIRRLPLQRLTFLGSGTSAPVPRIGDLETTILNEPACDYLDSPDGESMSRLRGVLGELLKAGERTAVWFHNPALARNPFLCGTVRAVCAARSIPLILHHHDFWCDGRWERWPILQRFGFLHPHDVAGTVFADGTRSVHVTINRPDAMLMEAFFPGRSTLMPNPVMPSHDKEPDHFADDWLRQKIGHRPLWICPTRFLRRKNLLEALLLKRVLCPEACLATTSAGCSPGEARYAAHLRSTFGGEMKFGLAEECGAPPAEALLARADVFVSTAVQEGFGLVWADAARLQKPLLARRLPNVDDDLRGMGFSFPHIYSELEVPPDCFDWKAEQDRLRDLQQAMTRQVPHEWREWIAPSQIPESAVFSGLTLDAQMEILRLPADHTARQLRRANPWLGEWQAQVEKKELQAPSGSPVGEMAPGSYAALFEQALKKIPPTPVRAPEACQDLQDSLARRSLENFARHPVLWA